MTAYLMVPASGRSNVQANTNPSFPSHATQRFLASSESGNSVC